MNKFLVCILLLALCKMSYTVTLCSVGQFVVGDGCA